MSSNPQDLSAEARIRLAAVDLFGSQGFAHTTVRQVAQAAGVSPGLVMHHFGSKEQLRQACDDWAMAALAQEKRLFTVGAPPCMDTYLDQHPEYRPLLAYLVAALRAGGDTASRIYQRLVETSAGIVDRAVAAGMMREPDDRDAVVAWLVASSCGVMLLAEPFCRQLGGAALTDPRVVARYGLATTQVLSEGIFTDSYAQAMRSAFQHEDRA